MSGTPFGTNDTPKAFVNMDYPQLIYILPIGTLGRILQPITEQTIYRDSNSQFTDHESPSITTGPAVLSTRP